MPHPEVLGKRKVGDRRHRRDGRVMEQWGKEVADEKDASGDQEIKRENATGAPDVEGLEIVRRVFGVQEDASDQESGKHEKQVDSTPAQFSSYQSRGENWRGCSQAKAKNVMRHQHHQDRHAPQPV